MHCSLQVPVHMIIQHRTPRYTADKNTQQFNTTIHIICEPLEELQHPLVQKNPSLICIGMLLNILMEIQT
jgi:hypothetical protein